MISLHNVNQRMIKIASTQPATSPQPSTSLWGKQIHMSDLYRYHRQFPITPKENYQDQLVLIQ